MTIPREKIRRIELCYATTARHPFCQYFLGFVLLILGVIGLFVIFFAGLNGTLSAQADTGTFVIPLVPVALWLMVGAGFWILIDIFKASYHLMIDSDDGIHKIFFDKKMDVGEILLFIRKAQLKFGYSIDVSRLKGGNQSL